MQNCLKVATDLAIWTHEYAKSLGHPLILEFDAIQRIAVSLYIENSKGAHIQQMHDLQQERNTPNANSDFSRAGSQVAADAAAERRSDPPPLPWPDTITDDDVPF